MSESETGAGGDRGAHHGAPANFWSLLIGLLGVVIGAGSFLYGVSKTDQGETTALEGRLSRIETGRATKEDIDALKLRLCRLEARAGTGECKF